MVLWCLLFLYIQLIMVSWYFHFNDIDKYYYENNYFNFIKYNNSI